MFGHNSPSARHDSTAARADSRGEISDRVSHGARPMSVRFKQAINWLALLALVSGGIVWPSMLPPM
jgi:hypothetical protein